MSTNSVASAAQLNQLKEILNQNQNSGAPSMNGGKRRSYRSRKHTKKCGGNKLHMGRRHKKHHKSRRHKKHHSK